MKISTPDHILRHIPHFLKVEPGAVRKGDAATQLEAPGDLSRASNLPASIKPILNSPYRLDLMVV